MAHLLVVEDEHVVSKQLERRLKAMGHSVVGCASNAADSIDMARDYNPDLIFMDIVMPGDMDGIDAAEIIGREYQIPVIFLTAWADDETIERAKRTMPYGYIIKPYHISEIKAAIDMTLHRSSHDRMIAVTAKKFITILDAIDAIFISVTGDLTIHHVNRAGTEFFGRDAESLKVVSFTDLIAAKKGDSVAALVQQQFSAFDQSGECNETVCCPVTLCGADGVTVTYAMTLFPCFTPSGPQVCIIGAPESRNQALHCAICSHCKRIRNDRDEWIQLETYISTALDVAFSHSICPGCIKKYYPDLTD